jgi:S-adenosyl-L-methionine hydrolase (adenosine-forming)
MPVENRPGMAYPTLALITDFGSLDAYAGGMHGVIQGIAPGAVIIDVCHDLPAGGVSQAAFRLWQAFPYFPDETVFVAVVDPGVGTRRRGLAARLGGRWFVGPDNGLLTYARYRHQVEAAVSLENPAFWLPDPSSTFHGRDIFAPVAAHLAGGVPLEEVGPPAGELIDLPPPRLAMGGTVLHGQVLIADRFGNLMTSLGRFLRRPPAWDFQPWIPGLAPIRLAGPPQWVTLTDGRRLPVVETFGDLSPGEPLAYIGSDGLLELAMNNGRASEALGVGPGDQVQLHLQEI